MPYSDSRVDSIQRYTPCLAVQGLDDHCSHLWCCLGIVFLPAAELRKAWKVQVNASAVLVAVIGIVCFLIFQGFTILGLDHEYWELSLKMPTSTAYNRPLGFSYQALTFWFEYGVAQSSIALLAMRLFGHPELTDNQERGLEDVTFRLDDVGQGTPYRSFAKRMQRCCPCLSTAYVQSSFNSFWRLCLLGCSTITTTPRKTKDCIAAHAHLAGLLAKRCSCRERLAAA